MSHDPANPADTSPDPIRTADLLRARGSLKWTGTSAPIAAWVAESDLGTAPAVTAALHEAVERGLTGYLPPAVRSGLARACADFYADVHGWPVPAEWVKPVPDVLAAMTIAIEHFSRPGSAVVLPTPAYMPFVAIGERLHREIVQVPMTDGDRPALDLDGIDRALAAGAGTVVLVNPHNPTGRVHTVAELTALAAVVERHGARVFADEIHAPLVMPGHRHVPYASLGAGPAGHTLTATSASKAWNVPGLACAQVLLSNEADAAAWHRLDFWLTHGTGTLGAVAATAAYDDRGPYLERLTTTLAQHADLLGQVLAEHAPQVAYRVPEGTYLAWLDLRAALGDRSPDELDTWLAARAGVAVTDGRRCGTAGRGHVRLTLAMPPELVVEAGRRIAGALGD